MGSSSYEDDTGPQIHGLGCRFDEHIENNMDISCENTLLRQKALLLLLMIQLCSKVIIAEQHRHHNSSLGKVYDHVNIHCIHKLNRGMKAVLKVDESS